MYTIGVDAMSAAERMQNHAKAIGNRLQRGTRIEAVIEMDNLQAELDEHAITPEKMETNVKLYFEGHFDVDVIYSSASEEDDTFFLTVRGRVDDIIEIRNLWSSESGYFTTVSIDKNSIRRV